MSNVLGVDIGSKVARALASAHPVFDPAARQAEADARNARAVREHSTDRWCACLDGAPASLLGAIADAADR